MSCDELLRLRAEAAAIKSRMDEQRRKARATTQAPRDGRPTGASEYLPLLQRKLERLAETIQHHVASHRCQD